MTTVPEPMLDLYAEHRDEAAFLRERRVRLDGMLEGDARHERMLDRRLCAHLDALQVGADDAFALVAPWLASKAPHERYVALAATLPTSRAGEALAPLQAGVPITLEVAVRAALEHYGQGTALAALESWLATGDGRHQSLALRVLARWGDPRTEKIARRALRREGSDVHRAALDALATIGARDVVPQALAELDACETPEAREDVLASLARMDVRSALGAARRLLAADLPCGTIGPVLAGAAGTDEDRALLSALSSHDPPDASVLVGLVLARCHTWIDPWWEHAHAPAVSNALREASYALVGGEVPPRVLGARAREEPDETAARVAENRSIRAAMREVEPGTPGRWGARDATEFDTVAAGLGPRHRAWAALTRSTLQAG